MYTLHCKEPESDPFVMDCLGYEDLGDVLEDLARLHVETGQPPSPADCEYWILTSADLTEFAVAGKLPYHYGI